MSLLIIQLLKRALSFLLLLFRKLLLLIIILTLNHFAIAVHSHMICMVVLEALGVLYSFLD